MRGQCRFWQKTVRPVINVREAWLIWFAVGEISDSTSFIIPQWGSVIIHDPSANLATSFATFASQLQLLLGLPQPSSVEPKGGWQIAALVRSRLIENARDAVNTLSATTKLAKEISNMRINKEVRSGVRAALSSLNQVRHSLSSRPRKRALNDWSNRWGPLYQHHLR